MKKYVVISVLVAGLSLLLPTATFASFDSNLHYGSQGGDVTALQEFLTNQGLYSGPVNGSFGPLTRTAVINFQIARQITPASGFFGAITRTAANNLVLSSQQVAQATPAASVPTASKNGYQVCKDTYIHASWDGTSYTSSGGFSCTCDAGYVASSDGKSCEIKTIQPIVQPTATYTNFSVPVVGNSISSNIDGEFTGWRGDTLYRLTNGQYWQQSLYHYYYYYAYNPQVIIYSSYGSYKMHVVGDSDEDVTVALITNVIDSRINGEFTGWEGQTSYELSNGQIWEQTDFHYHYHYAYSPEVIIYRSVSGGIKMHVAGDDDQDVSVSRIY